MSKFSYGYSRYSFPFGVVPIPDRVFKREPTRGDVAVFRLPTNPSENYIKRLVGVPGDRIQVKAGILHINGEAVKRERIEDYVERDGGYLTRTTQYVETLPNGRRHRILEVNDNGPLDETPVFTVTAGHYFAMGDNRDNSLDSRVQGAVGSIPAENLVGRAEILFFSTDGSASWYLVWKWPLATRFERLFSKIS